MQLRRVRRAILFGVALALVARYCRYFPGDFGWMQRVGVPWLAVAFAATIGVRDRCAGAALGALSLGVAIAAYYADAWLHGVYDYSPLGIGWLALALPGGAAFGVLGAHWSAGRGQVMIAALMSACFAGEGIIFHAVADAHAAPYMLGVALVLPVLLVRHSAQQLRAVALAVPLVAVAMFAEAYVFVATGYLIRT